MNDGLHTRSDEYPSGDGADSFVGNLDRKREIIAAAESRLLADMLAAFPGATIVGSATFTKPSSAPRELHSPTNGFAFAVAAHRLGWRSLFPQQRRGGSRAPSKIDGRTLRFSEHVGPDRSPSEPTLERWIRQARSDNLALVNGGTERIVTVDVDVGDAALCERVVAEADRHLGRTPLRRIGRAPRIALLYLNDQADPVGNTTSKLTAGDWEGSYAVETLATKPVTLLGDHHRTGYPFVWPNQSPVTVGPEAAPVVTRRRYEAFLKAIDDIVAVRGLARKVSVGAVTGDVVDPSGVVRPGGAELIDGVTWHDGKVVDGREQYLHRRAAAYAVRNKGLVVRDGKVVDTGCYAVAGILADECLAAFAPGKGRMGSPQSIRSNTLDRVRSAAAKIPGGELGQATAWDETTRKATRQVRSAVAVQGVDNEHDLDWLPPAERRSKNVLYKSRTAPDPKIAATRALSDDRRLTALTVAMKIERVVATWLQATHDRLRTPTKARPWLDILQAPTGAGKSSTFVRALAGHVERHGRMGLPFVFCAPSYANLMDMLERARGVGGREIGKAESFEAVAGEIQREAAKHGLQVLVYKGKERAGCRFSAQVKALQAAHIPASGLCRKQVRVAGELEDRFCVFYDRCDAIRQRRLIAEADIVLCPTSFLTLPVPEELEAVAGVVLDERCWPELVGTTQVSLADLQRERKEGRLSKLDRKVGVTNEGMRAERHAAHGILSRAVEKGICPGTAFADEAYGLDLAKTARTITSRAQDRGDRIYPGITDHGLQAILEAPQGVGTWQEHRLWGLIVERVEAIHADRLAESLAEAGRANGFDARVDPTAKGSRDHRILVVKTKAGPQIRMSWRVKPNWSNAPILMLDASAAPAIVRKLWPTHDVREPTVISAPLHLRTVACLDSTWWTGSMLPERAEDGGAERKAARALRQVLDLESTLAHVYGNGRVLTVAPMAVRRAMREDRAECENVDSAHFGAVRGLDFARHHGAVLVVGRQELRVGTVDGLVAALTYDDDEPEPPVDPTGTGFDADGQPVRAPVSDRAVQLRDGSDLTISVPEYAGRWAYLVQAQYREEEIRQGVGRVRPVYRDGQAPLCVLVGKCVPTGIVVDDVFSLSDLADTTGRGRVAEAIRRIGLADAEQIERHCPDLVFKGGIGPALTKIGLDASLTSRWAKGFTSVDADLDDGMRTFLVPSHMSDPVAHVQDRLRRDHLADGDVPCRIRSRGADLIAGVERKRPDKLDVTVLGTREERSLREDWNRDAMLAWRADQPPAMVSPFEVPLATPVVQQDLDEATLVVQSRRRRVEHAAAVAAAAPVPGVRSSPSAAGPPPEPPEPPGPAAQPARVRPGGLQALRVANDAPVKRPPLPFAPMPSLPSAWVSPLRPTG